MLNQIVTHLARILMLNALLSAVLIIGSVAFAWYAIISFAIDAQYVSAAITFVIFLLTVQFLNRAVLPVMKAMKAQRDEAI